MQKPSIGGIKMYIYKGKRIEPESDFGESKENIKIDNKHYILLEKKFIS